MSEWCRTSSRRGPPAVTEGGKAGACYDRLRQASRIQPVTPYYRRVTEPTAVCLFIITF